MSFWTVRGGKLGNQTHNHKSCCKTAMPAATIACPYWRTAFGRRELGKWFSSRPNQINTLSFSELFYDDLQAESWSESCQGLVRSREDPVVPFLGLCSILACLAFIHLEQLRIFIMTKLSLYLLQIQTFNLIYQLHRRVSPIWKPNILKIFQWLLAPLQFGNCWNFGKRGKIELRVNFLMWQCIR